jgi:hypothetical protein
MPHIAALRDAKSLGTLRVMMALINNWDLKEDNNAETFRLLTYAWGYSHAILGGPSARLRSGG